MPDRRLSRRSFLGRTAALGGAVALSRLGWPELSGPARAATPRPIRPPGSLPHPKLPAGTDTLPKIDHIVVVMMENHSFDNYLGMLGRGDGFALDHNGRPTAANRDDEGNLVRAFRMPSTCQLMQAPGQNWNASHIQYDNGRNDGFVRASGPVAMGYWTKEDLPFYYGLARTFPLCDSWFGSCLGQTYPNRRFLLAGTAHGLVSTDVSKILAPSPPNGLIFDQLDAHGISWRNYFTDLPSDRAVQVGGRQRRRQAREHRPVLRRRRRRHAPRPLARRSGFRHTTSPRRTTPTSRSASRSCHASSTRRCTVLRGRRRC